MNLDCDPWIVRLNDQVKDAQKIRLIGTVMDLGVVEEDTTTVPAIFVCPFSDQAEKNEFDGVNRQRITEVFSIIIAVQNHRDQDGLHDALKPIRTAVKTALLLWQPSSDDEPVERQGGEIYRFNQTTLWWHDRFLTRYHENVTEPAS